LALKEGFEERTEGRKDNQRTEGRGMEEKNDYL
jgi:hypothetical protein